MSLKTRKYDADASAQDASLDVNLKTRAAAWGKARAAPVMVGDSTVETPIPAEYLSTIVLCGRNATPKVSVSAQR